MKSEIFALAIRNRNKMKLLYDLTEFLFEPYFMTVNSSGKKIVFGRINNTSEIKMFEFERILNIKVLECNKFSPIIPIMPILN